MSFKRAGDDHCALRYQKKQRVTDLLAEDIPADEACQTRSGRFVCLVCPHNPVLDTMAMLTLHRQGRKHLANVAIKIEKEHDLSELFQKRKQEMYLREASTSSLTSENSNTQSQNTRVPGPLLERTRQLTEAIRDQNQPVSYNKSRSKTFDEKRSALGARRKNAPFFQSRVEIHLPEKPFQDSQINKSSSTLNSEENTNSGASLKLADSQQDKCTGEWCSSLKNNIDKVSDVYGDVATKTRAPTKQQQHYLKMKMSGWILDRNGKWIKDESVEFDSDEDEPPSVT